MQCFRYTEGMTITMTKRLIDIPDELLDEAMTALGAKTKAEAVRAALRRVTQQERQRAVVEWIIESDPLADLRDPEVQASAWR